MSDTQRELARQRMLDLCKATGPDVASKANDLPLARPAVLDDWRPDKGVGPRRLGPADLPPNFPHGSPLGELTAAQSAPPRPSTLDMTQQAARHSQENDDD